MIVSKRVAVLTGLPGSGKTTVVNSCLEELDRRKETYVLGAPTGKAARRLQEVTGRPASTVHRMLNYHPAEGFRINETNRFTVQQIIVDEFSMMDTELTAALMRAIDPRRTRLCLTGDAYQLPSVGSGRVLGDVIDSGVVPMVELTEVHRAAAESWICRSAPVIKAGQKPNMADCKDFSYWQELAIDGVERSVLEAVQGIVEGHKVRPCVITPRRTKVGASTESLNPKLQAMLNPHGQPTVFKTSEGDILRIGDVVIQRKNNYGLGVFNGEIGEIIGTDKVRGDGGLQDVLIVHFEGHEGPLNLNRNNVFSLRLAYTISAHGSQGSQWPWLVVICHSSHGRMLTRQILYTMVTRAMKGLVLVGDDRGLMKSLMTDAPQSRRTGLVARLRGEL